MLNENKVYIENLNNVRLLVESVSRDTVADAITNKDVVFIYYSGDETINRGYRTIEPFTLGVSTAGNVVLRAWQQAGATDSGNPASRPNDEIPGWRLFRLDGITSMSKTLRRFETARPKYNPQDRQMTANFQQEPTQQPQEKEPEQYKTMTNDKNWFQTQYDKFKKSLFKQQPNQADDNAGKRWMDGKKAEFDRIMKTKQNKEQNVGI